jgi:hypothetical protein
VSCTDYKQVYLQGVTYRDGRGVPRNDSLAVTLFQRACDGGEMGACASLGRMYDAGLGVPVTDSLALKLFKRACDGQDTEGCDLLRMVERRPVFQTISAGSNHTCGLTTDGRAWCWGENNRGQLGDGTRNGRRTPGLVANENYWIAGSGAWSRLISFAILDAGYDRTCGLTTAGAAYCWGADGPRGDYSTTPVAFREGLVFQAISVGDGFTCGLTADGEAHCWGGGPFGSESVFDGVWGAINARGSNICGLRAAGGGALCGRFYDSGIDAVEGGHVFKTISVGYNLSCGLLRDGIAVCWSYGTAPFWSSDRLGHTLESISAGLSHACGLTAHGAGYCWGANEHGQTGNGGRRWDLGIQGGIVFKTISAGAYHTCGITTSGAAFCWGRNSHGQLGDGTAGDSVAADSLASRPIRVAPPA